MTICIAALAEDGKKLILAADQMITASIPIAYQFETDDVKKIYEIGENVVALTAGNALFAHEIIENSRKKVISANTESGTPQTVGQIAEIVRKEYQDYRRNMAIRRALEPRGLTIEKYYEKQQSLHPGVIQEIEKALLNDNIGVELIIAGHDSEEKCHIYSITHPGILVSHDALGHACVGIGAPHATYFLIGENYKKTMSKIEVRGLVEEAKRRSEVAPGVGTETTIIELPREIQQPPEIESSRIESP
ncbi:MAG: hypothetical protein CEE43_17040 [Promethearchaeota archaeon Loki_b32]|nr:MAG: hypothetical protein CEE43_17040 [Candidatus Lokiarchaeota archaeon Loki_b32]